MAELKKSAGTSYAEIEFPSYGNTILLLHNPAPDDLENGTTISNEKLSIIERIANDVYESNLDSPNNISKIIVYPATGLDKSAIDKLKSKFKVDVVVVAGIVLFDKISKYYLGPGKHYKALGRLRKNIVGSVDLSFTDQTAKAKTTCFTAGFFRDALEVTVIGNRYTLKVDKNCNVALIDTISKFDRFMKKLENTQLTAWDTETDNLNRVMNRILTIQCCTDERTAYIIPLHHHETTFTEKQLKYVKRRLRDWFETDDKKEVIFHNAKFDIGVCKIIKGGLGIRFMQKTVWDTITGEYALDENRKFIVPGNIRIDDEILKLGAYYKLDYVCAKYGFYEYDKIAFSKAQRNTIAKHALDADVMKYMAYDVLTIFGIRKLQIRQALDKGFIGYKKLVKTQFSRTVVALTEMSSRGILIDSKRLYALKLPGSDLEKHIKELKTKFLKSDEVKRTNVLLLESKGLKESGGLFGSKYSSWVFDMSVAKHMQKLVFEVAELTPLDHRKDGGGKLDKAFKKHYADVPIIKMIEDIDKANKTKTGFIDVFFDHITSNPDTMVDHRLRSNLDFIYVVTGRTSSNKPNLQNISQHGSTAYYVKQLFVPPPSNLIIEADYSAHEVRVWAISSKDNKLAKAFRTGYDLRRDMRIIANVRFIKRLNDTGRLEEYELELSIHGDIHKINYSFFFGVSPQDVTKVMRQQVKAVVFGVLYGKGAKSLAVELGISDVEAQGLINKLFTTFEAGGLYLTSLIDKGREDMWIESPIGARRHLWGQYHNKYGIRSAMDRRGPNSSIQGTASHIGTSACYELQYQKFNLFTKRDIVIDAGLDNYVHDSLKSTAYIPHLPVWAYLKEHSMTTLMHSHYQKTYGMEFNIGLETEFAIGGNGADGTVWNYTPDHITKDKDGKVQAMGMLPLVESKIEGIERFDNRLKSKLYKNKLMSKFYHNFDVLLKLRTKELKQDKDSKVSSSFMISPSIVDTLDMEIIP